MTINIGIHGNLFSFSIGRLKVNICRIFYVGGNTYYQKPTSFKENLLIVLGGPIFTLAQSILFFILLVQLSYSQYYAHHFVFVAFVISIMSFLSSIIPMEYNDIGFNGVRSDGLEIQSLIRKNR